MKHVLLILITLILIITPIIGQDQPTAELLMYATASGQTCTSGYMMFWIESIHSTGADVDNIDYIGFISQDAAGNVLGLEVAEINVSNGYDFQLAQDFQVIFTAQMENLEVRPVISELYDVVTSDASEAAIESGIWLDKVISDPANINPKCLAIPFDASFWNSEYYQQLTPQQAPDARAAIYTVDAIDTREGYEGQPCKFIDVWGISEEGHGYHAFTLDCDEQALYPQYPDENILIKETEDGKVQLWKLGQADIPVEEKEELYQVQMAQRPDGHNEVWIFNVDTGEVVESSYNSNG